MQQHMIQGFSPQLGRLHKNRQVSQNFLLPCEVFKRLRAQHSLHLPIGRTKSFWIRIEILVHQLYFLNNDSNFNCITPKNASRKIRVLILDSPNVLSVKIMGTSTTLKPYFMALNFISI